MASKRSYELCLLLLCLHVTCEKLNGREMINQEGGEWEQLNRLMDPPIHNTQFGGSLKEGDSDEKHHSNESESSNRSVHLREEPIAPDPPDYIRHVIILKFFIAYNIRKLKNVTPKFYTG
uniref:Uncharacterized protein n=1 Tax=Ananas comosus var. bracteatus TaxID=296719 RepID=A0A6V7NJB1_ANACO|nr:unnamed protein product [Ananas comosus var. bracteatus]